MHALARILVPMLVAASPCSIAVADALNVGGFVDYRGISAPQEASWTQGGFGKTRYGGGHVEGRFGQAGIVASDQLTSSLSAHADVQFQTSDRPALALVESYLRYRPVSTIPFRVSIKAGAFFAPISYENSAVGWTSPWTITPSAINSWVGEELRTIGTEGKIEWRSEFGSLEVGAAVFGVNDPAGTLLELRGWSLSDATYGLGSKLREPDAVVGEFGQSVPARFNVFQEIDGRPGWYSQLAWHSIRAWDISLLRYDNQANGAADTTRNGQAPTFAWHTSFWSLSLDGKTGPITWIAQAVDGKTSFEPEEDYVDQTRFRSAFLLAGVDHGNWRPALRFDYFTTTGTAYLDEEERANEHGYATTVALNWQPRTGLRVTGEVLRVESFHSERADYGMDPKSVDTQIQVMIRLLWGGF